MKLIIEIQYFFLKFNEKFIKFEQEYLNLDADRFYQDGERVFTSEEIRFMEILRKKNNFLGIREIKKILK